MAGNSFGHLFRITTFGESHGPALGVIVDGCPPGLAISREEIQAELNRRRPGQDKLTTPRDEKDSVEILSGVFEGESTGTPIAMMVRNENTKSKDYESIKDKFRPGHADYTYLAKYGRRDWRGSGRASARETLARVAAGAIAKKLIAQQGMQVVGYVKQIGQVEITQVDESFIEQNPLRCPDPTVVDAMTKEIEDAREDGDSVGGILEIVAHGVPAGLGEPVFDKLSATLAHALASIPTVKGLEIGDGFTSARRRGSENNDQRTADGSTSTNHAGGIVGGISNGEDIVLRLAMKPPSSIAKKQETVDKNGQATDISVLGRHDPCVCQRAVPIAEAMVALVLADHLLLQKSLQS